MPEAIGSTSTVFKTFYADGRGYDYFDGTSMATPHAAGVGTQVWNHFPTQSNAQIRDALAASAWDRGDPGRDVYYGYGIVQAAEAISYLLGDPTCSTTEDPETSCNDGVDNDCDGLTDGEDADECPDVNALPTASFTFSCTDLACSFDGSGSTDSDGTIASYAWDFGDGNIATGATASHTYGAGGTYTVTLTVTDDDGASGGDAQSVSVTEPVADTIELSATGYKVRGQQTADLTWGGATSTSVDVWRNGVLITTTANDGAHTDNINIRGPGTSPTRSARRVQRPARTRRRSPSTERSRSTTARGASAPRATFVHRGP